MRTSRKTPQQAIGLRHIAEELNVSVSLVSKVLSGRLGTSGANAEKIRAIHQKARELNYRKNLLAEALRTGRQNVLAIYLHRHGAPGSGIVEKMVSGIAEEATRHHQRLLMHYYETIDEFRAFCPDVHRNAIDGVIIGGVLHPGLAEDLRQIHDRSIPVVTIHHNQLDPVLPNVGLDQAEVSRRAAHHLIDCGCRRIAHFRVPNAATSLPSDRHEGYRTALRERGIDYLDELVIGVSDFSYPAGHRAAQALLSSGVTFDGILGQSDHHVIAAANLLIAKGMRIPEDVRLIGIDNAPFCEFAMIPLSSVSQEFKARGARAVQMLLRKLEGEEIASVNIDPVVWIRDSSSREPNRPA